MGYISDFCFSSFPFHFEYPQFQKNVKQCFPMGIPWATCDLWGADVQLLGFHLAATTYLAPVAVAAGGWECPLSPLASAAWPSSREWGSTVWCSAAYRARGADNPEHPCSMMPQKSPQGREVRWDVVLHRASPACLYMQCSGWCRAYAWGATEVSIHPLACVKVCSPGDPCPH